MAACSSQERKKAGVALKNPPTPPEHSIILKGFTPPTLPHTPVIIL